MRTGARTPEEIETLFEDAFVTRDREALAQLFGICTPGGFEDLVIAMSEPARTRTQPRPPEEEPDMERIAAIAQAHGAELLA